MKHLPPSPTDTAQDFEALREYWRWLFAGQIFAAQCANPNTQAPSMEKAVSEADSLIKRLEKETA